LTAKNQSKKIKDVGMAATEVAVLADNWQITSPQLAVADNIRSLISLCSPFSTILNRQFHLNYLHLSTCEIIDSKDDCVALGSLNGLKKERFGICRADNYPAKW